MKDCLFCKIINKEIPSSIVYEDGEVVAFKDINPKGRVHLLIVPSVHINGFLDLSDSTFPMLTNILKVVQRLVRDEKIESSFRIQINGGARQEVPHLHLHLIGD